VSVEVPTNPATPVNVTTPVEVLTEYVPSPVTVRDVAVQLGALSFAAQSRTDSGFIVAPDVAVSLLDGFKEIATAVAPDFESARAVGGSAHCTTIIPFPPLA
jgi:hypothetical protein